MTPTERHVIQKQVTHLTHEAKMITDLLTKHSLSTLVVANLFLTRHTLERAAEALTNLLEDSHAEESV